MGRDLTKAQFRAACKRRGFIAEALGFYIVGAAAGGGAVSVYSYNAGRSRRARLAYLIAEATRLEAAGKITGPYIDAPSGPSIASRATQARLDGMLR